MKRLMYNFYDIYMRVILPTFSLKIERSLMRLRRRTPDFLYRFVEGRRSTQRLMV